MAEQTKALTAQQQKAKNVQAYLMARAGGFKALLPKHLTPERMVRGLMAAASRNPTILECHPCFIGPLDRCLPYLAETEPMVGFEPTTPALRKPCSSIELRRPLRIISSKLSFFQHPVGTD